ncbi:urea ABC transporter ATP-binding subunit UrtE [Anthocerotibacter panamensis]|uniref:urea ABC transporter ATP-binding subunit UrtE n=1 Tax=Anthocerotibacter panamensis TaxID=2857077 RepID=UPI001C4020E7|nr:urea ABC transporter ATP-binding subunit UrtE [Anthocerotibacter panamensis]
MLEVQGLNVYYGQSHILRNIDLSIPEGAMVCLIGRNGVGKTTLLKSLIGLLAAKQGRITLAGQPLTALPADARARRGIAYVPQGREIFSGLTVYENLVLGLEAAATPQKQVPEEIFELFPVLKTMANRRGGDLSGGQQQQLAIGRALVSRPKVLLLDEPTEGIQPSIVQEIEETLAKINRQQGLTILFVEQNLEFARRLAHRFHVMEKGRLVAGGTIDALQSELVARYLTV